MPSETEKRPGIGVIAQAVAVWVICMVLSVGVEDGGFLRDYFVIASSVFWGGSWLYFRSRRFFWPSDLWAFRLGPFILLVLGLVGATVLMILGREF